MIIQEGMVHDCWFRDRIHNSWSVRKKTCSFFIYFWERLEAGTKELPCLEFWIWSCPRAFLHDTTLWSVTDLWSANWSFSKIPPTTGILNIINQLRKKSNREVSGKRNLPWIHSKKFGNLLNFHHIRTLQPPVLAKHFLSLEVVGPVAVWDLT